jgi:hypothetical protein
MSVVPPFRVDATTKGLRYDMAGMTERLAQLRPSCPIVIMVHGYRHEPGHRQDCPHCLILSAAPEIAHPKVVSWPAALGLNGQDILGIAFGWPARGLIWGAYARAGHAGRQLAALIALLPADRPIHIIAHSFGARVALRAISLLPAARVKSVVLLAAAELRRAARIAAARSKGTDITNICTHDNWFYDAGLRWVIGAGLDGGLGHGLGLAAPHWHDLQIDHAATRACLADLGYPVAPARARICHWSAYLRPGAFTLYRAIMTGALPVPVLAAHLAQMHSTNSAAQPMAQALHPA